MKQVDLTLCCVYAIAVVVILMDMLVWRPM